MALADSNSIAYNKPLREQLQEVHNLLGEQATDVANAAMLYNVQTIGEIQKVIKAMSTLAGTISVILLEAKSNKELDQAEKSDHGMVKGFAEKLGNAQFEMQDLIRDINQFNELADKISNNGVSVANTIMDLQHDLISVRANMNALGYLSSNPGLANLFELENSKH